MSLLLDALNKADEERKRNESTPGISSNHNSSLPHNAQNHSVLIIVAVIVVGLLILLTAVYWLGKQTSAARTEPTSAPEQLQKNTPSQPATTGTTIAPTAPAVNQQSLNQPNTVQPSPNTNNQNSGIAPANDNGVEPAPEENVANLYQQNTQNSIAAAQPKANPQMDVGTPVSINQFSNLQEIRDLPNNVLERIPSLNYTEHHFNANGGSVVINGSVRHVNDQLANGLVIDKILEDGMILHFENYSFKMRALNSWVNM